MAYWAAIWKLGLAMHMLCSFHSLLSVCVLAVALAGADLTAEEPVAAQPQLILVGGGVTPKAAYAALLAMAGKDPKLVIIPNSPYSDEAIAREQKRWQGQGFADVQVLTCPDRESADLPHTIAPLQAASAVWIKGGFQQELSKVFVGTAVEQELYRLLERGGVIGGSSAGAAIQSRVAVCSEGIITGFDLLPGVIVDQHFFKRDRTPRLTAAVVAHPDLIGLGIDESTALIVRGDQGTVVGKSSITRIRMHAGEPRIDTFSAGAVIQLPGKQADK